MIERVIYKFACACGHTWQGLKYSMLAPADRPLCAEDLGRCVGCDAPITEAMEAAAEPLGIESDGPDPRAPELLAFGVNVEACTHRFIGVRITNGKPDGLRCTECGSKVGESTLLEPPSSPCTHCGGSHPLVEHYGTAVCPTLAPKAAAVDAEITARVLGLEVADSREIDALRDLRALVLRVDAEGLDGNKQPNFRTWRSIGDAARAAMTPATFDPAQGDAPQPQRETADAVLRAVWEHWAGGDVPADLEARIRAALGLPSAPVSWRNLGRSLTTTMPTEEHECSHCHMVTHARVGMGPPATCPGCGR